MCPDRSAVSNRMVYSTAKPAAISGIKNAGITIGEAVSLSELDSLAILIFLAPFSCHSQHFRGPLRWKPLIRTMWMLPYLRGAWKVTEVLRQLLVLAEISSLTGWSIVAQSWVGALHLQEAAILLMEPKSRLPTKSESRRLIPQRS